MKKYTFLSIFVKVAEDRLQCYEHNFQGFKTSIFVKVKKVYWCFLYYIILYYIYLERKRYCSIRNTADVHRAIANS